MTVVEGWKREGLGYQLELIRNGYSGQQLDHFTDFPVSRIETISDGKIDMNKVGYVDFIPDSYLLKTGDLLFSNINSLKHIGKVAQVGEGTRLFHGMNLLILRPGDQVDKKFLFYKLINAKPWFEKMAAQAINQASINQVTIKELQLELPQQKAEQAKIADILSTVDRAIEQTEALIAKQQRIKTGLMQDLLTRGIDEHGNLRTEQTHKFKDSPLGRIPMEWANPLIGNIAVHVGSGVTPRGGETVYTKEGILFIRSQNVHFGGLQLADVSYIPQRIHDTMRRSEVFENDVLLNITGASIGRCCAMPKINCPANVNQHVCAIRLDQAAQSDAGFLVAVIESSIGQNQILKFNAGGNREGLNYEQVKSFVIPWPEVEERQRSHALIKETEETLEVSRLTLEKLCSIKTGLMQDLLTGKKRVVNLLKDMKETYETATSRN